MNIIHIEEEINFDKALKVKQNSYCEFCEEEIDEEMDFDIDVDKIVETFKDTITIRYSDYFEKEILDYIVINSNKIKIQDLEDIFGK